MCPACIAPSRLPGNFHFVCSSSPLAHGACPFHLAILPSFISRSFRQGPAPSKTTSKTEGPARPAAFPPVASTTTLQCGRSLCHLQDPHATRPAPDRTPPALGSAIQPHHPYCRHQRSALVVPFDRTETFLRFFLPRYTRMWNFLV